MYKREREKLANVGENCSLWVDDFPFLWHEEVNKVAGNFLPEGTKIFEKMQIAFRFYFQQLGKTRTMNSSFFVFHICSLGLPWAGHRHLQCYPA